MIDHVSLNTNDIDKAKLFYQKALAPLGYTMTAEYPEYSVAGFGAGKADLWISGKGTGDSTQHISFAAQNKEMVVAFHKAGLEAGGKDNGAPGYRKEYTPGYYAAFVLDTDGHNIEVVFHDPNPSE